MKIKISVGPASVRSGFRARSEVKANRQASRKRASLIWAEALELRRLLSLVPPALHSVPGASKVLYLDFVGSPALTFISLGTSSTPFTAHGAGSNSTPIPAFTMDSDASNFSSLELTTIQNIWAVAAEKYSPFNIDVTTVDPGNRTHGTTEEAIIGGSYTDWYGTPAGGLSAIGGFTDTSQSNFCFDWTGDLTWTTPNLFYDTTFAGVTAAHEAGHGFGLVHEQSPNSPNTQYYDGNSLEAPIMGNGSNKSGDNAGIRATWWMTNEDTGQQSTQPIQDELSVLSGSTDGFDYKTVPASPVTLTSDSSGNLSGSGIIINATTQADKFQFTAIGTNATFNISNATWGGMLAPTATITTTAGQSVTTTLTKANTNCIISSTSLVLGQSYYLTVSSSGGYGNIGQYTIAGTNPATVPTNDNFANAGTIGTGLAQVVGSNIGATAEPGEPINAAGSGGHSVWWNYTPPVGGSIVKMFSNGSSFDTTLGVYTGSDPAHLTRIVSDDNDPADTGDSTSSFVQYTALPGVVYHVSVDGQGNAVGSIKLTSLDRPLNDDFASAAALTITAPTALGQNAFATSETGEPRNVSNSQGASIWYKWTATSSGTTTVDTLGSIIDTTLGVYTGSNVNSLTLVQDNDNDPTRPGAKTSLVSFTAVTGTTYYFSVDTSNNSSVAGGAIQINLHAPLPDFQPYQPAGWSGKLVVSTTPGVFTDSGSITSHQNVYVDSAVLNAGTAAGGVVQQQILLDGNSVSVWNSGSLGINQYTPQTDFNLGKLAGGTHTLEIIVNYNNAVFESDATNNTFTRTFNVTSLTNTWTGNGGDGSFDTSTNWSLGHVPTSAEDAVINTPGSYGVTSYGTESVYSLTLGSTGGGSSPTVLSNGGFAFGPGNGSINTGATFIANGDTIAGTLNNAGTLELDNAAYNGAITNSGTILAQGATSKITPGPTSISGSFIRVRGGSTYSNGHLDIVGAFTNNGTLELTDDGSGGYVAEFGVDSGTFTNNGLISARLGASGPRILDGTVDSANGLISVDDGSQLDISGNMNVGSGTTMLTGSTSAPTTGILKIDASAQLEMLSSNFTYTALAPVLLFAPTANLEGPFSFINQGTLSLYSNIIDAPIVNQGTIIANNTGDHLNGTLTTAAGSTLEVFGSSSQNNAELTIANGFTNNGTIILTDDGSGGYAATLNVSTGTLTNAGTISVPTASPGPRALNATIDTSAGTIAVSTGVALDLSSGSPVTVGSGTTLTGPGTIHIGATTVMKVASAGFTYAAGSASLLFDATADLSGPGIFTNKSTLSMYSNVFDAPISNQGTLVAYNVGNSLEGALTTTAGSMLEVIGSSGQNNADLTIANGFTNNGTITLTDDGSGGYAATLNVSTGTLNNAGTISIPTASPGPRVINAIIDTTAGAISVSSGVTLDLSSGSPVTVGSGTTLSGAGTIHIGPATSMNVASAGFTYAPGSATLLFSPTADLAGPGIFTNNSTLSLYSNTFDAPIFDRGTLVAYNTGNKLNGALTTAAGSTLEVIGSSGQNNADLTIANGFTNNGTITLTDDGTGGYAATLSVSSGTLTNAGTISVPTASPGPRALNGTIDTSTGTISVSAGVTLDLSSGSPITVGSGTTLAGPGTIHIGGTTQMKVAAAGFTYAAGSAPLLFDPTADLAGPGTFTNNGTLSLFSNSFDAPIFNNQGTLIAENTGNILHGTLTTAIGSLLEVVGSSTQNNADLTISNGFTNNGTLELTDDTSGGYAATLTVGGVLQNPGVIRAIAAANGPRTLNASLANTGSLLVETPLTLNAESTAFTNAGSLFLTGGDLTLTNANSISNSGTINFVTNQTFDGSGATLTNQFAGTITGAGTITDPVINAGLIAPGNLSGTSFGTLTVNGNYQQTTGTLRVTLGGYNVPQYDSLITTNATIGGMLDIRLATGFVPVAGHSFLVMAIPGTQAGAFSAEYGLSISNNVALVPTPSATGIVLVSTANNSTIVTNTNDSGAGSLRQAILNANGAGATVTFSGGVNGTITLSSGLVLTQSISITGPGTASVTVLVASGNTFEANAGTVVSLSNLTITSSSGNAVQADAGAQISVHNTTLNGGVAATGMISLDTAEQLTALSIGSTGKLALLHTANAYLLGVQSLSITTGGILDIGSNAMVIHNNPGLSTVNMLVKAGSASNWSAPGIDSSAAASNTTHLTALAVIVNNDGASHTLYGTQGTLGMFFGTSPMSTDELINYTYYGDTTINGNVDGSDYTRIDNGYLQHLTGWFNGDLNYDGIVNGSDYTLIDNAFNTQGASLAAQVAPAARPAVVVASRPANSFSVVTLGNPQNTAGVPISSIAEEIFDAASDTLKRQTPRLFRQSQ